MISPALVYSACCPLLFALRFQKVWAGLILLTELLLIQCSILQGVLAVHECVSVWCREMWAFANNDDIRRAIHAQPISKIGRFDECSDRITYTHDTGSMIPIHAALVKKGAGPLCIVQAVHD